MLGFLFAERVGLLSNSIFKDLHRLDKLVLEIENQKEER